MKVEVYTMLGLYVSKVLVILGGYRDTGEIRMVESCFYRHLSPEQAAQVVINSQ